MALDIVLVADVNVPVKHWEALASLCEKELVQFKVVPSYFSILVSGLYLETLSGIPILGVSRLPLDRMFNKLIKRLIDIVGSIVGLLLSAPLDRDLRHAWSILNRRDRSCTASDGSAGMARPSTC